MIIAPVPADSPRKIVTFYFFSSSSHYSLLILLLFSLLFCRQIDELRRQRAPEVFVRAQAHISGERPRLGKHTVTMIILLCACSPGAQAFQGLEKLFARVFIYYMYIIIYVIVISNVNSLGHCSGAPCAVTYIMLQQLKCYCYIILI